MLNKGRALIYDCHLKINWVFFKDIKKYTDESLCKSLYSQVSQSRVLYGISKIKTFFCALNTSA